MYIVITPEAIVFTFASFTTGESSTILGPEMNLSRTFDVLEVKVWERKVFFSCGYHVS